MQSSLTALDGMIAVMGKGNSPESLQDILVTVRHYIEEVPQLKRSLWESLNTSVKEAIANISSSDYQFLAG